MRYNGLYIFGLCFILFGCQTEQAQDTQETHDTEERVATVDSAETEVVADTIVYDDPSTYINTGSVHPDDVVSFAKTLKGIPYAYACSSPSQGFDCSGFINYVFDHFNIDVPRSSVDFTNIGREVPVTEGKPGDIILFTGTDSSIRRVGHMGIVIYNNEDSLSFIHSSSGSANSVTITPLNSYYKGRFVKVIRIFKQNESVAVNR